MADTLELKGFADLDRALAALPDEIARKAAREALRKGAVLIQRAAQARAPVQQGDRVHRISSRAPKPGRRPSRRHNTGRRPGFLRASILVRINPRLATEAAPLVYSIGWSRDAFYGSFLEFGTKRISPRPFLTPAAEQNFGGVVDAIGRDLGPRIEAAAKRLAGHR